MVIVQVRFVVVILALEAQWTVGFLALYFLYGAPQIGAGLPRDFAFGGDEFARGADRIGEDGVGEPAGTVFGGNQVCLGERAEAAGFVIPLGAAFDMAVVATVGL